MFQRANKELDNKSSHTVRLYTQTLNFSKFIFRTLDLNWNSRDSGESLSKCNNLVHYQATVPMHINMCLQNITYNNLWLQIVLLELIIYPMKLSTTRCRTQWAKMKSAKALSALMSLNTVMLAGLVWILRHTEG